MNWLEILRHSYSIEAESSPHSSGVDSRLEYLSEHIFDFTTYDSELSEKFATKALEVCVAISRQQTFEYIQDDANNEWYTLMCNLPFFSGRIDWGTSIRGAWWHHDTIRFQSCGLWNGDDQLADTITFTGVEWREFIDAIIDFASEDK